MALFHAQHTLTQGSLRYRLATLGYQKRNTYGVVPINHMLTQGSLHYRLATLGYQRYNAYSVEKVVLLHDL